MDVAGAALLPKFGGYAVEDARGEVLALVEERDDAERMRLAGHDWLLDAGSCGHPAGPAWAAERRPVTIRIVTQEEADEIREEGTPLLQREP